MRQKQCWAALIGEQSIQALLYINVSMSQYKPKEIHCYAKMDRLRWWPNPIELRAPLALEHVCEKWLVGARIELLNWLHKKQQLALNIWFFV